jgi:tetratricopeptide (TPR) repeat protein
VIRVLLLASLFVVPASGGVAADRVWKVQGSESGTLRSATREGATLDADGKAIFTPVEELRWVQFDDEPPALTQARLNVAAGGYGTALKKLQSIDPKGVIEPGPASDLDFYTAYCIARLALAGQHDVADAGKRLSRTLSASADSHHYYDTVATLGDLLLVLDRTDKAIASYDRLAESNRPAIRVRGHVLAGRALASAGDHAGAIGRFDAALAIDDAGPGAGAWRTSAIAGKAASLASSGKLDEGLALARRMVEGARRAGDDAQDAGAELAAAYNALGDCLEGAGRPREALFARLHVDLLCDDAPEAQAEALAKLVPLWRSAGKEGEADRAAERLLRQHAGSPWARTVRSDERREGQSPKGPPG